jgi:hypothetical protein
MVTFGTERDAVKLFSLTSRHALAILCSRVLELSPLRQDQPYQGGFSAGGADASTSRTCFKSAI